MKAINHRNAGPAFAVLVLGAANGALWLSHSVQSGPEQIFRGGAIYSAECAQCHGSAGQGQPGWDRPGPDGLLPAPPHDATGHTWQHSDKELLAWVLEGPKGGGAPLGYRSRMPAYAGRLTADQVEDVIAWIKVQWPPGVRAYQETQNSGGPSLDSVPGDWRFPVTCKPSWGAGG